ncbi:MAG: hypothetical protein F6K41_15600 [Symploca sp. SIO3E6]|nr:hypothetical protein [Caldora sp. SIO3E6]
MYQPSTQIGDGGTILVLSFEVVGESTLTLRKVLNKDLIFLTEADIIATAIVTIITVAKKKRR